MPMNLFTSSELHIFSRLHENFSTQIYSSLYLLFAYKQFIIIIIIIITMKKNK